METRRVLFWLTGTDMGNMSSAKGIVNTVLLPLQLCLGLWQIAKLTPVWAFMRCTVSWLMMILFPCLSCCCSDYILLKEIEGRVFKKVTCYVTTPVHDLAKTKADGYFENRVLVNYLGREFKLERMPEMNGKESEERKPEVNGKESEEGGVLSIDNFILERKEGDKLYLNDVLKYYVTDEIWNSILCLKEACNRKEVGDKRKVFIKNHKEIWEEVVTGRVMSLEELLDSMILDNHTVSRLDHEYFLPIDLMLSEEKILKVLNLVGLFLQKQQHIHWLIPALLSLTSAVMGFSTTLRRRVYGGINKLTCCAIHFLCRQMRFSRRRDLYSLGNWIENLKPNNDLRAKIVRADILAVIAGGAKIHMNGATLVEIYRTETLKPEKSELKRSFKCGTFDIVCEFQASKDPEAGDGKCSLTAGEIATVDVDCNRDEALKLFDFAAYMAHNKSGSLRTYDPNTKTVLVRRFRDSVIAYVRSGYPPLYALQLKKVLVR